MIARYHPAKQYRFCAARIEQPTYAERVRHEEAAQYVTKLAEIAWVPPWHAQRMDANALTVGPIPDSFWFVRNAQTDFFRFFGLLPEAERERMVLETWQAFSARRLQEDLRGADLRRAAMAALLTLEAHGALEQE